MTWLALTSLTAHANTDVRTSCEESWKQIYAATATKGGDHDVPLLLQRWLALEKQCRGTDVYSYQLSALYIRTGQPRLALTTLDGAKTLRAPYAQLAVFTKLLAQVAILADEKPIPMDKIREFKPQFVAAMRDPPASPNNDVMYGEVANYMMLVDDVPYAIAFCKRTVDLNENQWIGYRTLTIAYMRAGNYTESIRAARRGQEVHNALLTDPDFMYAVSKSYAAIGNITAAKKTLGLLLGEVPGERGTAEYRATVQFIVGQIKSGNDRN